MRQGYEERVVPPSQSLPETAQVIRIMFHSKSMIYFLTQIHQCTIICRTPVGIPKMFSLSQGSIPWIQRQR